MSQLQKIGEAYKIEVLTPEHLKHFSTGDWVSWEVVERNRINFLEESRFKGKFNILEKIEYAGGDSFCKEVIVVRE